MRRQRLFRKILIFVMFIVIGFAVPSQTRAATEEENFCNLIVFVKFQGDSGDAYNYGGNWAEIKGMYDTAPNSMYNYMKEISRGKLIVNNYMPQEKNDGSGVVTYTLSGTLNSYSDDTQIIGEVIAAINNGDILLDFSANRPDYADAGILDNLTIVIQGETEDRDSFIYPHMSLYPGFATNVIKGSAVGLTKDIHVGYYNVLNSDTLVPFGDEGIYHMEGENSTISHEFLHTLGLPDLYRYSETGDPVGVWSVMGATTSMFIQYPLSYSREQLGWIDIDEITADGNYTLNNVTTPTGNVAYKLTSPLSASEYFIIEYRKKSTDVGNYDFECQLPGTGLIVYRVDTSVEPPTNAEGENYIYLFRPYNMDTEEPLNFDLNINDAGIEPAKGEYSYGSTDLTAGPKEDTIYYSNGQNSGIELSNIKISSDGESISFDVEFADYENLDLWDDVGDGTHIAENILGTSSALDSSGNVYVAYTLQNGLGVEVKKYDGASWTKVGDKIYGATSVKIEVLGDGVYLLCGDSQYIPTLYKLESGTWGKKWAATQYANTMSFVKTDTELFAYYDTGSCTKLVIRNAVTGDIVSNNLTAAYFSNPAVEILNGSFYVLYSDFMATDNKAVLKKREADGSWKEIKKYNISGSNIHGLATNGNNLTALVCVGSTGENNFSVYNGSTFTKSTSLDWITKGFMEAQVFCDEEATYISGIFSTSGVAKMMTTSGQGWEQLGEDIMTAAGNMRICDSDDGFYGAVSSLGGTKLFVKTHSKNSSSSGGSVVNPTVSNTITVTPPVGYTDTSLWVDGKECKATLSGGKLTYELDNSYGKTICMYKYNSNGIPTNMYVWTLKHTGTAYEVIPQPGLEDLLSYHGFSVRVAGQSGIRFKTGVSATTRDKLTGSGVDGFTLVEYGTVVMNKANMSIYPLIKGGTKTTYGRAYWKDGNTVNDYIFETVNGRYRYASVLIGIPVSNYKTEFAFRGYMILSYGGKNYTIYGPVVSRSIYYVSKQVIASGQFSANTSAYKFLQKVISDADAYGN